MGTSWHVHLEEGFPGEDPGHPGSIASLGWSGNTPVSLQYCSLYVYQCFLTNLAETPTCLCNGDDSVCLPICSRLNGSTPEKCLRLRLLNSSLSIGQILEMSLSWIRLSPSLLDLSVNFLSHQFMQYSQPMAVKLITLYRYLTRYNNLCIPNYPPFTGPGCKGDWDSIACWERAEFGETVTIPCPRVLRTVFGRDGEYG